jgi:hypothetical protein
VEKEITVIFHGYRLVNPGWSIPLPGESRQACIDSLRREYEPFGITVSSLEEPDTLHDVSGYGDFMNTVRLRSPKDHISNLCLGHVIGQSANCDLAEDIRRAVSRIAFAPEMVEPEGSNKIVCHNCGCGC